MIMLQIIATGIRIVPVMVRDNGEEEPSGQLICGALAVAP
jgi:hypothetical protein